jgi:hypothetical protein
MGVEHSYSTSFCIVGLFSRTIALFLGFLK